MMEVHGTTSGEGNEFARVKILSSCEIESNWFTIEQMFLKELKTWKRYWTLDRVKERLITSRWNFWAAKDSTGIFLGMITEVCMYETGKKDLVVHWLGGEEFKGLDNYFFIVEEWARLQGCDEIVTYCRPGVYRLMKKYGFKDRKYSITKPVTLYKEN